MAAQKLLSDVNKSADVVILLNGKPLAGQAGAILNQHRATVNITNKINPEWEESIAGTRSWNVKCSGTYVLNQETLQLLEYAFMNNAEVELSLTVDGIQYIGKALITDFPINTVFNNALKYNISLLGTGELKKVTTE